MTAQQLKNSILQMAVQGKLVPQDPNDEPASMLLERIRAEKERLIREKKIKREKNPSVIFRGADHIPYEKVGDTVTPLEVPFEIPESWEWVRLVDVCEYIQRGKSPQYSPIKKYPVVAQKCNQWSGFSIEKAQFIDPDSLTSYGPERILQDNDLMWNSTGLGTLGRMAIYKVTANPYSLAVADSHVTVIRSFKQLVLPEYLYFYFSNPTVQSVIEEQADGTTKQKELATATIKAYLTPIPPLDEQRRILAKLSEVLPIVQNYGEIYGESVAMQDAFPNRLKKSILQQAVQGKLVPQNPADEPAEVLLERIRAEKQRLIQEGKIKKDKHESIIFRRDHSHYELVDGAERCIDAEIPFEIPENWVWTRFGTVINLLSGTDFAPNQYNSANKGIPYITGASNLDDNRVLVNRWTETPRMIANRGDILLVCKGSGYGKTAVCDIEQAHIARQIMAIKKSELLDMLFVKLFLTSNFDILKAQGQGVIPGIDRSSVLNLLFPLPPRSEQHRIAEKVQELFAICGQL